MLAKVWWIQRETGSVTPPFFFIAENPVIGEESHHVAWEIRQEEKRCIVNRRNCVLDFFTLGPEVHGIK